MAPIRGERAGWGDGGRRARRGQQGSVLLLVLAIVAMLSIGVLGVLNLTTNSGALASQLEFDSQTLHRIDGAVETAVNDVRRDDSLTCPDMVVTRDGYDVECVSRVVGTDPESRTMDLNAMPEGTSDVVARARVRVVDEVNGVPNVGYSLEVCDWLLGAAVSDTLQGCS